MVMATMTSTDGTAETAGVAAVVVIGGNTVNGEGPGDHDAIDDAAVLTGQTAEASASPSPGFLVHDALDTDQTMTMAPHVAHEPVGPVIDYALGEPEEPMGGDHVAGDGVAELHAMQQIDDFLTVGDGGDERSEPTLTTATATTEPPMTTSAVASAPATTTTTTMPLMTMPTAATTEVTTAPMLHSRRQDKITQIQEHPLVRAVAADGRTIECKCGKSVRLNPPWYILKYEQHIVSRNCTYLRKKTPKRHRQSPKSAPHSNEHGDRAPADENAVESRRATEEEGADLGASSDVEGLMTSNRPENAEPALSHGPHPTLDRSDRTADEYGLKTAEELLQHAVIPSDMYVASSSPSSRPLLDVGIIQAIKLLQENPQFNRVTPDGRFVECKCSALIILNAPWDMREFLKHVADKANPPKTARRKIAQSSGSRKRPRLGDGAAFRIEQRLLTRDIRWQPVVTASILPCPGFRDERAASFVAATTQITGGSRPKRRIAEELFPHLVDLGADDSKKNQLKLSPAEKVMLHDAVEGEALWYVDRDALSIRSLDCKGTVSLSRNESMCSNCMELRSNHSLRISMAVSAQKNKSSKHQVNAKYSAGRPFSLLEQEFDMSDDSSRILRDLFLADVEEGSIKNMWFDMAELGISGMFDANPSLLGLIESMLVLKEKERRGVGRQNMSYSQQLDSFMKRMSEISTDACDLFQHHLGGRKQKYLVSKKRKVATTSDTRDEVIPESTQRSTISDHDTEGIDVQGSIELSTNEHLNHLFGISSSQNLSMADMQDVDLTPFQAEGVIGNGASTEGEQKQDDGFTADEETDGFLSDFNSSAEEPRNVTSKHFQSASAPVGFSPCTGLRDEKVQAYVTNAVQIIGGSRPKYVIAKELFPEIFGTAKKIKIVDMLNDRQRNVLQDAVFSECLWRVDKVGSCVRSLRCMRRVDKKRSNGACNACLDLKSVANFRSVLCRARVPKNVENLKFVPSVYTEADPFMRKLSKNASLRALYQAAKGVREGDKKKALFWLRFAKMGLFGQFRTHPVFEGLIGSMVEIKDRERRGVGRQNMTYAKPLDEFLSALSAISAEAAELFSVHFCGRKTRSQKGKRKKTHRHVPDITVPNAMGSSAPSLHAVTFVGSTVPTPQASDLEQQRASPSTTHHLITADDLLAARPMSTADIEENQRLMDRMLDEVRLSVNHDLPLQEVATAGLAQEKDEDEHGDHLDPQTYLDENGVLTTVL